MFFSPKSPAFPSIEHLDVMSTVPVDRQTFSAWDNYVDFSTEVGGGWKQRFTSTFVFFLFRVSDVPSWDPIYLWYIIYIHILFTWCIYMTWYYLYTYTFTQHSDFFPTFWTAGPLTKVRYQKHGSFGELFLFFSGRKWGQNCKVKRWNCSAGATAVPSREPPWEKENHLQKVPLGGDMLVFRRADVSRFFVWLNPYWSSFPNTIFQGLCLFGGV